MGRGRRLRRLAVNLSLLAASTGLTLAALEIGFRRLAPQPLGLRFMTREGLYLHYPGSRIRYRRPGIDSIVTINSEGLRDREYPPGKPEDVYRILVLGDSFTEGLQVGDEEVWPKRAERRLRATGAGEAGPVELVNASISGWGTADALRYLESYGPRWKPDLVLLAFYCGNDVKDNLSDGRVRLEGGELTVGRRKPPGALSFRWKRLRSWAASRSHTYQFVRDRLDPSALWRGLLEKTGLREPPPEPTVERDDLDEKKILLADEPEEIAEGWRITEALLDRLAGESARQKARFALVALPSRWMVDEAFLAGKLAAASPGESPPAMDPGRPGRRLAAWAARRGVPCADLLAPFRARGVDRGYHFPTDAHWNPRGHEAAAEEIARFLLETGLLP